MKKFSIITLFLALLTMTVQAQENTYNMVIEMTNGTKITIGPNDIRSLTFNNGELTVTGQSLQEWMEQTMWRVDNVELNVHKILTPLVNYFGNGYDIDAYEVSEALVNRFEQDRDMLMQHDAMMQQLQNKIYELYDRIARLEGAIVTLENRIANLEAQ